MAEPSTREHAPPVRPAGRLVRPALVVAFPVSLAMELPASGQTVGREWLAGLGISDQEASGKHAVFTRLRGGALELQDAGSRNGTWVDGAQLDPGQAARLVDGTLIRVGRTLLVYREQFFGDLAPSPPLEEMVGPFGLRGVGQILKAFARSRPANVLITGETGSGKELAASAVARVLGRASAVAVNLGAVSSGVFESQLFGHVAGAFSDARKSARGMVASAEGGAVFFDELGELPLDLQPKLLRLLENREVQPVGSSQPIKVDVSIIAATNRDLAAMVLAGTFRRDLLARVSAAVVPLPALRERIEDVFAILIKLAAARGELLVASEVEIEAIERLLLESFPNNVRDLVSILSRVRVVDPEPGLRHWALDKVLGPVSHDSGRALTNERIEEALRLAGGNESEAARRLGVSRGALRRFLAARR